MMNAVNKIYLDYAATTPVDKRVLEAMRPYFREVFGNPSSIHQYGQEAESALEKSRETVASVLNCQLDEVIFTSCGSESDNLALRGVALAAQKQRGANHILISPVEHHAISLTAANLAEDYGFILEHLPVDRHGAVNPKDLAERILPETALVSVIYANNEIGTVNPIAQLGEVCRSFAVPFHTDAVQAAAYLSMEAEELHVDLMSIGAHKFYGPKGVGALYIRKGIPILPILTGGGQEFGLRAGTHNIPYIVGMAEALQLARFVRTQRVSQLSLLRDHLIGRVLEEIPDTQLTGHPTDRLPNHASFVFEGVDGNLLLTMLDVAGFACSSGSACKTGDPEPSEVLSALSLSRQWALGSLRVTLGDGSSADHIEKLLAALPNLVDKARKMSALQHTSPMHHPGL